MNKMLTAVAVSAVTAWAVGYSAMASAEATVYGRVVAGAIYVDGDNDTDNADGAWNFGAVGHEGSGAPGSRFGFKGSTDLGNGMEAGFQIERSIGKDATGQRHNNLYLSGGWGKLTLGQQSNPYMSARKWDQTNFYGGQHGFGSSYRHEGVKYSMSTGGFSLDIMANANDDNPIITAAVEGVDAADAIDRQTLAQLRDDYLAGAAAVGMPGAAGYMAETGHASFRAEVGRMCIDLDANGMPLAPTGCAGAIAGVNTDDWVTQAEGIHRTEQAALDALIAANAAAADITAATADVADAADAVTAANAAAELVEAATNVIGATEPPTEDTVVRSAEDEVEAVDPVPAVRDDSNGIDGWVVRAGYDFGVVNLDVAVQTDETDAEAARNNSVIGLNGSAGPMDWYLAYQTSELQNAATDNDIDSLGGFLGFNMSERDIIYAYHVAHSQDVADDDQGEDFSETIVGYSRQIGPGVKFIAEYQSLDNDLASGADGDSPSKLALAIKMDF